MMTSNFKARRPARAAALMTTLTLLAGCGGDEAADVAQQPPQTDQPATAETAAAISEAPQVNLAGMGYSRGDDAAPVTVVEFSDFGCPYCARFALETYPQLEAEFVEPGQVRWQYVPFVLGIFANGAEAALAAECAGEQDDFWPMHDLLFERQSEWKRAADAQALFAGYAASLGLDADAFRECYDTDAPAERLAEQTAAAEQLGIRATPTFIVNGRPIQGALPADQFRRLLQWSGATGGGEAAGGPQSGEGQAAESARGTSGG